ncbi:TauD/TfdA family dioxygenase [Nocardia lijiangensis]|uniref:TauD/TfdA family dioxygenase n=1 Tax=Nocardia lijiangensis TaxID=299618 RepID=UPI003D71ED5A
MYVDIHRHGTEALAAALTSSGIATFDGIPDQTELARLGSALGVIVAHRDSGTDGVTTLADLGRVGAQPGYAGFSNRALPAHTDRSGIARPPHLLMVACGHEASTGGECIAIDGKAVYDDLAESMPEALRALSHPRSVLFGGTAGHLGSVFEHTTGGRVRICFRLDELVQYSPETGHWLPALIQAIERHTTMFALPAGHGYVINNHRWLHGRRAFTGNRIIYRLSVDPFTHYGIPTDFAPTDPRPNSDPTDTVRVCMAFENGSDNPNHYPYYDDCEREPHTTPTVSEAHQLMQIHLHPDDRPCRQRRAALQVLEQAGHLRRRIPN